MSRIAGSFCLVGLLTLFTAANAQSPPPLGAGSAFDGTYRLVSSTNVNTTYTDRNGRMAQCPSRRPGPLHIVDGRVRYTNATGYKLKGTVGPQGELAMSLLAPPNSSNAGSQPLNLSVRGQIDSAGTAHLRQISNSCSYDFVWQKQPR
ncbi:MAG TPA: hypothetical protein VL985_08650 [Stellaceae bacterium]|nr:hypothetical protein [Stellaceae bacterium]